MLTRAGFSLLSHVRSLGLGKPNPMVRKSQILIISGKEGRLDGNRRQVFLGEEHKAGPFFFVSEVFDMFSSRCVAVYNFQVAT